MVQIDGIHITEHLALVAAIGIDGEGVKHPLGLFEGATEHAAVVQALIHDLVDRGLDPAVPPLFIIDGSKALAKAIRRSFGRHVPIRRCQIHKARNVTDPEGAAPGVGGWMIRTRPRNSSATSPSAWNVGRTASPRASWKGWTRSSL